MKSLTKSESEYAKAVAQTPWNHTPATLRRVAAVLKQMGYKSLAQACRDVANFKEEQPEC